MPYNESYERIAELQRLLMEEEDPQARAAAHLELGRVALNGGDYEVAVRHFREALVLDPRLERARRFLQELGEESTLVFKRAERPRSILRRFLKNRRASL